MRRRKSKRDQKELGEGALIHLEARYPHIRACPGEVVTTPPNQALGDTGLAFLEEPLVSPRHPVPGGRNRVSKLWAQKLPPFLCGVASLWPAEERSHSWLTQQGRPTRAVTEMMGI